MDSESRVAAVATITQVARGRRVVRPIRLATPHPATDATAAAAMTKPMARCAGRPMALKAGRRKVTPAPKRATSHTVTAAPMAPAALAVRTADVWGREVGRAGSWLRWTRPVSFRVGDGLWGYAVVSRPQLRT